MSDSEAPAASAAVDGGEGGRPPVDENALPSGHLAHACARTVQTDLACEGWIEENTHADDTLRFYSGDKALALDAFAAGAAWSREERLNSEIVRGDDAALTVKVLDNFGNGRGPLTPEDSLRAARVLETMWHDGWEARALLRDAAVLFRSYEAHHRDQATKTDVGPARSDRDRKAERNAAMAQKIEDWLRPSPEPEREYVGPCPVCLRTNFAECADKERPGRTWRCIDCKTVVDLDLYKPEPVGVAASSGEPGEEVPFTLGSSNDEEEYRNYVRAEPIPQVYGDMDRDTFTAPITVHFAGVPSSEAAMRAAIDATRMVSGEFLTRPRPSREMDPEDYEALGGSEPDLRGPMFTDPCACLITTPDPRFSPVGPVWVNGFKFVPASLKED